MHYINRLKAKTWLSKWMQKKHLVLSSSVHSSFKSLAIWASSSAWQNDLLKTYRKSCTQCGVKIIHMLKWYVWVCMLDALSVGGLVFVWIRVAPFLLAYFDRNRSRQNLTAFGDFESLRASEDEILPLWFGRSPSCWFHGENNTTFADFLAFFLPDTVLILGVPCCGLL